MREHPIPQDITGYQFHIIGNMTIKQFAEVAAGCFIAFLIYTTNLPGLLKWPLMMTFAGIGAMAAFVPIAERPLDEWIVIFIRVLYKPTKFFWRRDPKIPEALTYQPRETGPILPEVDLTPVRRERVREYLTSLHSNNQPDAFDAFYQNRIGEIVTTFGQVQAMAADVHKKLEKPDLQVKVRNLTGVQAQAHSADTVVTPQPTVATISAASPGHIPNHSGGANHPDQPPAAANPARANLNPGSSSLLTAAGGTQPMAIPENSGVQVDGQVDGQAFADPAAEVGHTTSNPTSNKQAYIAAGQAQPSQVVADQQAQFNQQLPFPAMPETPNKPVGMVLGPNNELVPSAIVELVSESGAVARAVKTNSLGQFFVTTPLGDGTYTLTIEKDGYQFPSQQLQLAGDIIPPVEIKGQLVA